MPLAASEVASCHRLDASGFELERESPLQIVGSQVH